MPYAVVNDAKLYFEDTGGDKPVVLFTHGIFFSSAMFRPQFEALKAQYRCIGLDWRGQGQSEVTLGGYDVDNLASDCMALMTHLGVDQFHWVGLSIGGVVGIRMAAEHPSRIKSLFAIGAAADCEPYEKLTKYESLFDKILVEGFESIRAQMAPIIFGPDFLADESRALLKERWIDIMCANDRVASCRAAAPILRRRDIRYLLPHVKCPVFVTTGEHDGANGPARAQMIHDGIVNSQLEIIPRAGHTPTIEEPNVLNTMLMKFLEQHA
ncbi:alpha/beta fold hydrolase [Rhodoferax sp.]|uniref:alpha/beta fold hydrolase n=1 Tax=Rhodoferax sp. TaxID=50421 RepID=UPI002735170E|nr:alpha/beta hydrolase [Rhodoferax sp.]MDP3191631.1 alpha/beta hydrolase [Rhodoferax sp.]MDP3864788.1 alpha/beta hydrolase [Rhodoferax sp.]